jgi:putative acetyltransferase
VKAWCQIGSRLNRSIRKRFRTRTCFPWCESSSATLTARFQAALLAPLAVDPIHQKQGVGSALIQAGLRRLREEAFSMVCVLGDPAYYGRFGFKTESSIGTPYPIPPEWSDAWQSQRLVDAAGNVGGKLSLPRYWLDPALWSA